MSDSRTRSWRGRRRRAYVAAAALAAAVAASAPAAANASTGQAAHPASSPGALAQVSAAPKLPGGSRVVGAVAASARVSAAVAMRLPDSSAVTAFIDATANPRSGQYHRYLSKGQFSTRFGPSTAAVAAVERQLRADGLTVTGVSGNHLLVNFTGSAAQVGDEFHTGLERVRLADGTMGRATTSAVRLPSSIAGSVQAVVGLDQLVHETAGAVHPIKALEHGKTLAPAATPKVSGGPVACSAAQGLQATGALTDQQLASAYGLDPLYAAGDLGAGQTVDIYELEPYLTSDVAIFDQCYFGADHTSQITDTLVDGGPGTGPGSGEAALDIDNVSALAPAAKIHVFSAPNNNGDIGELDNWNAIAMADDARQVSSSWGLCETAEQDGMPGMLQVENEIFEQTAAQGQTIYSSAGDDGSDDCASHASTPVATNLSLDDPASQPYVTSVGGTTITDATEPPSETVWNNGNAGGGGGGGISEAWAMPPWQTAKAVAQTSSDEACSDDPSGAADDFHLQGLGTTLPSGTECRETPDVSALADPQTGYTIVYDGGWYQIGGTSASTPLWAALTAEMNASSQCSAVPGGLGLGFATPLFYEVASSSSANYAAAFSNVTIGNNDNLNVGGAVDWQAGPGYNLASGLGTPRVTDANGAPGLDAQLCAAAAGTGTPAPPQVSSLSSDSGPAAGGGTLTISGTGFGSAQGSVFFGNVDATVVSGGWTATAITVDVPAYQAPAGNPAGSAGRAIVTVVTAGHQSSAPAAGSLYEYTAKSSGAPVVDYVSTADGLTTGGNTVDIVGSGFTGATAVDFGDVPATNINVLPGSDGNELSATVPASDGNCAVSASQGVCAVQVTVTTPAGTSSGPVPLPAYQGPLEYGANGAFFAPTGTEGTPQPDEYDYTSAPTITSVSPAYASENGTTAEVITGTGFNLLTFDWANVGTAGPGFNQDFEILGVTPTTLAIGIPASAATVEPVSTPVSVQDSGIPLPSTGDLSSFDYAGTPVLTAISKHLAAQSDPGSLTITGQGLSDVTSVVVQLQGSLDFLSSTSTAISSQSDTSLKVAIPEGFAAPADVLVCSVTGCSAPDPAVDTLTLAYPGRPVINSLRPASGPAHGGNLVEINGALDSELTAVHFGSQRAALVYEPSLTASGTILVVAPPGKAGAKVPVTISTLGGTLTGTPTSKAVTYIYTKSSPTAPRNVSAKAGTRSATVSWKAPSNNGGSSVTGYVITLTAAHHKTVTVKVSARVGKVTIKRLATVSWTVEVQAVNKLGRGLPVVTRVRPRS
ncbi:MAG TPA: IPT/TIG domain-containing protein [Streptosporangiaceae bacterium]|nr:IPT/TIG domain-containing protein [Streptosporangiaceae bacterium]